MSAVATESSSASPTFRRRLLLRRVDEQRVAGEIEDHIHHFAVTLEHRDGVVVALGGRAVRAPWSLCPGATAALRELVGVAVGTAPGVADARDHCTHLLDLAQVTVRFAGTGADRRRFDMAVDGAGGQEGPLIGSVRRDDGLELTWTVVDGVVTDPGLFAGRAIGAGFGPWVRSHVDAETAELALLLRRATWMSPSIALDLDDYDRLVETAVRPDSCFATRPDRIVLARRNRGSSRRALTEP